MNILLEIIITILSVIGLKTVCTALYGKYICDACDSGAKIIINVIPTKNMHTKKLVNMLNYIKIKYLPEAEICVLGGKINSDFTCGNTDADIISDTDRAS